MKGYRNTCGFSLIRSKVTQLTMKPLLPSGPGDSRPEFGSSRERSKQLTRVPTGGVATSSFSLELQWCITPETLKDQIETGIVSGGQTQPQIDAVMDQITEEFSDIFEGMGRAKCDPIHIQMKEGATPVTQPKR